jgi:hypothetical protein
MIEKFETSLKIHKYRGMKMNGMYYHEHVVLHDAAGIDHWSQFYDIFDMKSLIASRPPANKIR